MVHLGRLAIKALINHCERVIARDCGVISYDIHVRFETDMGGPTN
jgi:hypothetical protein